MAITRLTQGIYQFTTIDNTTDKISFVTGTGSPFPRSYLAGISLHTSSLEYNSDPNSKIVDTIKNYGIIRNHGLYGYAINGGSQDKPYINSNSVSTTTVDTADKLIAAGSIFIITGTGNHTIILPDPLDVMIRGVIVKIFKDGSSTNSITINPTSTYTINGAPTKASTSAYCSIELVASPYGTAGWGILSSQGTWT